MAELACIYKPVNPDWEGTVHGRVYGLGVGSAGALTMLVTSTFRPASSAADGTNHLGLLPGGMWAWAGGLRGVGQAAEAAAAENRTVPCLSAGTGA